MMTKLHISVSAKTSIDAANKAHKAIDNSYVKTSKDIINSLDVLMGDIELVGTRSEAAEAKLSHAYDLLVTAKTLVKAVMQLEAKTSTSASTKSSSNQMSVTVDVDEEADEAFHQEIKANAGEFNVTVKFLNQDEAKFTGTKGNLIEALTEYYNSKKTVKEAHPELFK
jgi:uncharacterized membrane protein YfhO